MKKSIILILVCATMVSCDWSETRKTQESERWWTEDDRQFVIDELNRTTEELRRETENISEDQWNFREDTTRWSMAEIVEHLEIQNLLHYREIAVTSKSPQYLPFRSITEGKDTFFSSYSTDTLQSKAQWFLEPRGRYSSLNDGLFAFHKARQELTLLVEQTDIDFRKQFTFRVPVEGKEIENIKIGQVRDLHQLLLTGIAHTDRHLQQIRKIKQHENYP